VRWPAALLVLFSLSAPVDAQPTAGEPDAGAGPRGAKGPGKRKARGPRVRGAAGQPVAAAGGVDTSEFGPNFPVRAVRKLLRRDVSMAAEVLPPLLAAHPDDPELAAAWFALLHAYGFYGEALYSLRWSLGSAWYEVQGIGLHANALREAGQGREAAALRAELLVSPAYREGTELTVRVGIAHDLLAGGAIGDALAAAEDAVALFPGYGISWGALGAAQLKAGDLDAAWATLHLADREFSERPVELGLLHARLLWAEGDPEAAWAVLNPLRSRTTIDPNAWALRMELLVARDLASDAVNIADLNRFDRMQGPNMVAARVAALRAAGEGDRAAELLEEALIFNATSPELLRLR
jgi:predicted Zn-dependent protease